MANLIDLIYTEFKKAGYVSTDSFLWQHNIYKDFWVVLDIEGNYDLKTLQSQTYNRLLDERVKEPELEKNTSLLILNKVEKSGKSRERVIEDENDEFVFKKYVIQYTEEEWTILRDKIADDNESVGKLIMNTAFFEVLKRDPYGEMSLLYGIAHKLPFVTMDVTKRDYKVSQDLQLSDRLTDTLRWVDSIPKSQRMNPKDEELDFVKKQIEEIVLKEINAKDENRTDTNA